MDPDDPTSLLTPTSQPSLFRWTLGFLLVGAAWGLTTPFMRRAALAYTPPPSRVDPNAAWLKRKMQGIFWAVLDLLRRPGYAVPLLINITGSVWFFLLIGQAGEFRLCKRGLLEEEAEEDKTGC